MAYKCYDCGHIFESGEESFWSESRGEFWGFPCYENVSGCPKCKGEYGETKKCEICGSEHLEEELNECVCDECLEKYQNDIDMCFKVGSGDVENVKLNCFLASMFDKEEMETILFRELKEREKYMKSYLQIGCEKFVNSDRSWFAERLSEEVKKNENAKG